MRNDFAALIPPFVVAVAFIVAVAVFLRREMAPRRRRARSDRRPDLPGTGAAGTSGQRRQPRPDQAGEDGAEIDDGDDDGTDSGFAGGGDTGVHSSDASSDASSDRSSGVVAQEPPPGS